MSLVGTRPPTVDEWEQYELHHRSRMSTKPGISCFRICTETDSSCQWHASSFKTQNCAVMSYL